MKYGYYDKNGDLREATEVAISRNGTFVGWVPIQTAVDFASGKISESELCYDASKKAVSSYPVADGVRWEDLICVDDDPVDDDLVAACADFAKQVEDIPR